MLEEIPQGDEHIYVLYELPDCDGIHIGMMAESVRKHTPSLANIEGLDSAVSKAFFYNRSPGIFYNAEAYDERPVFLVNSTNNRKVESSIVINLVDNFSLEDIVRGDYAVVSEVKAIQYKK